jgi:hypothetical protein
MVKNDMPGAKKNGVDYSSPYGWLDTTVTRMLSRLEYCGRVVNFRTHRESYKDKVPIVNPKEDWKIFENRHEPLIDQATFDTVQKLRGTPRRYDKIGTPNPLTGILFCYDCKAKMYNTRHSERSSNSRGFKGVDNYNCSTYTLGKHKFEENCSGHFIRTSVMRELVLDSIRNICGYVRENQAEFVEIIREESALQHGETAKLHKKAIAKNERRITELDKLFTKAFESNANGKLSDKRYEQMTADYEREQAELETLNTKLQAELDGFNADSDRVESFVELVKRYAEFEELTTAMLNEFVHSIFVHKAYKNEWGERIQKIDIHFNFIGEFNLPVEEVEPTAEEVKALEERRFKLQKQREYNRLYRAKQKAKAETSA